MSLIVISNHVLKVRVDTRGAVLSNLEKDGAEYLWQGSPDAWERKDANLFPCVGRSFEGRYRLGEQTYPMGVHGFCQDAAFTVTGQGADRVRLTLEDNEETRKMYPFSFRFHVEYRLEGSTLRKSCIVENRGKEAMHFGLGSHPGFQVPLAGEGEFEDWYFQFPAPCQPRQVCFDHTSWLLDPRRPAYPLVNGDTLPLTHSLFDQDAIVLEGTPGSVTLQSPKSHRSVRVDYPGMPFVGFWHSMGVAPFVCVEPWLTLPGPHGRMADWETEEHYIHLPAGQVYENEIVITLT